MPATSLAGRQRCYVNFTGENFKDKMAKTICKMEYRLSRNCRFGIVELTQQTLYVKKAGGALLTTTCTQKLLDA